MTAATLAACRGKITAGRLLPLFISCRRLDSGTERTDSSPRRWLEPAALAGVTPAKPWGCVNHVQAGVRQ